MKVNHIACGPPANESESKAILHLKTHLESTQGEGEWILLSNLTFSINHQLQSDEIDIVVIGPPGVKLLEVKHWNTRWMESYPQIIEQEAERITDKARKIGTTLRHRCTDLPRVEGAFLLTDDSLDARKIKDLKLRGVCFYTLKDWKEAIGLDEIKCFNRDQVRTLSKLLEPKCALILEGSLRRFASIVNLELLTPKDERFHRAYRGCHSIRQDRVILHLYDISATQEKNAERKARREFEALQKLQLYPWAPRILDSFQPAPGYPGEMFFFTIVDPAAPTITDRANDSGWKLLERIDFARKTIDALSQMHGAGKEESPIIHRNLTSKTILVCHDGVPILTGFDLARIPFDSSLGPTVVPSPGWEKTAAPEVREGGLSAADQRSDVYSLCASLRIIFEGNGSAEALKAMRNLQSGLAEAPEERETLEQLSLTFAEMLGESIFPPAPPAARFWSEGQVVRFRDHDYRIVTKLGTGGVGITFKVIEIEPSSREELGTFVAKTAHSRETGERVLKGYNLARSHLGRHPGLSGIYEVANQWKENDFVALLTWIEGVPLADFMGVFLLLAEDQQEPSAEALAIRWLRNLSESLEVLHHNGLIHGDISPKNIIVSGGGVVLTDYDFVSKIGKPFNAPGTILYCSPSFLCGLPAQPSDDIYALAASFFHVIFDRDPFLYGGNRAKERGLNWIGINRDNFPVLASFLDKATNPDPTQRYQSASEVIGVLYGGFQQEGKEVTLPIPPPSLEQAEVGLESGGLSTEPRQLREEQIEWLVSLLQSYPGSRWGNRETRGLDTPFAEQTYVETGLEQALLNDIRIRRARLVILCGNAGDGKTALLQHLAAKMGFGAYKSAERIFEHRLSDGLLARINLDGAAAWRGRSAVELLDDFLAPFQHGPPAEDIAHLLAINDGPLLEWIETVESRANGKPSPLTEELATLLQEEEARKDSHICFISLNQRSLVGGITKDRRELKTWFLNQLVDLLYGGERASEIWRPCLSCSAQSRCEVFCALKVFGPNNIPEKVPDVIRRRARERLFEALEAVHLGGEVHITARDLRATLVFILFGPYLCQDYHGGIEPKPLPYWDLTFNPGAPGRQGEVLHELARFDPALEAHPQIDRYLQTKPGLEEWRTAPRYELSLESARRRAYFEWTENHLDEIAHDKEALGLARGKHLKLFRNLGLENEEMNDIKRVEICARLCSGVSRLEDLPPQALDRSGVVPLRITSRTPTETAFWIEKPIMNFRLHAELPPMIEGLDRLHRQISLIYRYRDGQEERLYMGAELFHLLLELSEGYQLGDVSTDDTFAHLSIYVQRLAREDEHELLAWNPMRDDTIFYIATHIERGTDPLIQKLSLSPLSEGEHS